MVSGGAGCQRVRECHELQAGFGSTAVKCCGARANPRFCEDAIRHRAWSVYDTTPYSVQTGWYGRRYQLSAPLSRARSNPGRTSDAATVWRHHPIPRHHLVHTAAPVVVAASIFASVVGAAGRYRTPLRRRRCRRTPMPDGQGGALGVVHLTWSAPSNGWFAYHHYFTDLQ